MFTRYTDGWGPSMGNSSDQSIAGSSPANFCTTILARHCKGWTKRQAATAANATIPDRPIYRRLVLVTDQRLRSEIANQPLEKSTNVSHIAFLSLADAT